MAAQGLGQLFQSASQALGIMSASGSSVTSGAGLRGILGQLGLNDRGSLATKLTEDVAGETDEQRRKRLRDQQQTGFGGQAAVDLFGGGFGGMGGLSY